MKIRKAKISDTDELVDNRLEFICYIRNIENRNDFKIYTREYIKKHLNDDSLLAFIAIDNGKIVSSCILCIYDECIT